MSHSQEIGVGDATSRTSKNASNESESDIVEQQIEKDQNTTITIGDGNDNSRGRIRQDDTSEGTSKHASTGFEERVKEQQASNSPTVPTGQDLKSSTGGAKITSDNSNTNSNRTGPKLLTFDEKSIHFSDEQAGEEGLRSRISSKNVDLQNSNHFYPSTSTSTFKNPSDSRLYASTSESFQPSTRSSLPQQSQHYHPSTSSSLPISETSNRLRPEGNLSSIESSFSTGANQRSNALTQSTGQRNSTVNTSTFTTNPSFDVPTPSPSTSASNVRSDGKRRLSLSGMSRIRNGWRYRLVVVQHPERARMCGFGDKDRRPLSPSLIVKLIITDETTAEEISPWEINSSLFFLAADLCHPDDLMLAPRNLLVHQHATAIPTSSVSGSGGNNEMESGGFGMDNSAQSGGTDNSSSTYPFQSNQRSGEGNSSSTSGSGSNFGYQQNQSNTQYPSNQQPSSIGGGGLTTVTMEHYTRNLVGAAVTSANVLRDEEDRFCIFFVLQDLSVRTEGVYRIRLVFTDLAQHDGDTTEGVSDALAEAYTEPFTVYSPRRFPGMLEPTELSKKLAAQGVKIAVRSDKKKRQRGVEQAELAGGPSWAQTISGMVRAENTGSAGGGSAEGCEGEMDDLEDEEE